MRMIAVGVVSLCLAACEGSMPGPLHGGSQQTLVAESTTGSLRIDDHAFPVLSAVYGHAVDGRTLLILSDQANLCEQLTRSTEHTPNWVGNIALQDDVPGVYSLMNPRNHDERPTAAAEFCTHAACESPRQFFEGWLGTVTVQQVFAESISGGLEFFVREARTGRASGKIWAQFTAAYCGAADGVPLAPQQAQVCRSQPT